MSWNHTQNENCFECIIDEPLRGDTWHTNQILLKKCLQRHSQSGVNLTYLLFRYGLSQILKWWNSRRLPFQQEIKKTQNTVVSYIFVNEGEIHGGDKDGSQGTLGHTGKDRGECCHSHFHFGKHKGQSYNDDPKSQGCIQMKEKYFPCSYNACQIFIFF